MAIEDRIRLPGLSLIHRRVRLLELLASFVATRQRLITVYAPSGYGKSILLADFAQTTDLPVCWCSLDQTDRDPATFLTLLAHSITDRFHEIELEGLVRLIERGDTQSSVRRIAEVLEPVGPHIVIIDDYHKASSAGVDLALSWLLEQLPDTAGVIIAARGEMTLDTRQVIDLLVAERAAGLSEEELRFTPEELQLLMRKRFGRQIDLATAQVIARATDGNIAQILLTGHLMHAERLIGTLQQRLGDDRGVIYGYLAEEVLSKQPPELQRFMLHTSVLPNMTADLCNDLLGITDAQGHIEEIVRRDLFVTQIGVSFRYHDLFAEFLRARLAEDSTRRREVCIRAAGLLAARSRYEEAVHLYLAVRAWDEAAMLLEGQGGAFYNTGRALTLNEWLAQMPESELQRHPRLLLLRGRILSDDLGDLKLAMTVSQDAERNFLGRGDLCGAAEASVFQSIVLRMMGRATDSLALATKALERLEPLKADARLLAYAIRTRGLAYSTAGDAVDALADLRQALSLYERLGDTYWIGMSHHDIGICLYRRGNITGAEHHYKQAVRAWEASDNANNLANTLNSLAVSLYTVGRYDEALRRFSDSLQVARRIQSTRREAFAQAGIGDVHLARRQFENAVEAYALSTALAHDAGAQPLEVYNLVKTGESRFGQGDLGEALRLASRAREIATEVGLTPEKGLACALQARVYVRQGEYKASFDHFQAALECFTRNDVLEEAKVHLWWGYTMLLDLRPRAALEHLQEAIRLALAMGELIAGLAPTVAETRRLLVHALHGAETSAGMRDSVRLLLALDREASGVVTPSLQVFLFGTPALIVAGERRQFSQRGRARRMPEFLAYLLVRSQDGGCRWSEASDTIWPDLDAERASISFHQTLKRLRDGVLGMHDYITLQDDYYQVNSQYMQWCDVLAFERLVERAAGGSPDEAVALLLEVIGLYQGEFLAGFEVGVWGAAYRASCEARFLQSVRLAAEELMRQGAPQAALGVIRKGLSQDYFREDLHHSAFRTYAQLGLHDELATHYAEMKGRFEEELGVSPDPSTVQLYHNLTERRTRG
jgi:LuxR family maltose regulon positive regulatory protein